MAAVSPFLPSLAELRNSEDCKSRQCVWTKKPKGKSGATERCSLTTSDGGRTQQLLRRLLDTEDTRRILEDLATLQLCKRSHREENIRLVRDKWLEEIKEERLKSATATASANQLKPSNSQTSTRSSNQAVVGNDRRARSVTADLRISPTPVVTPLTIRQKLQINEGDSLKCHGQTARNIRCTNPIARTNCIRIDTIVKRLTDPSSISSDQVKIKRLLEELSGLVLCKRFHQDQAPELFKDWLPKIADITVSTRADIKISGPAGEIKKLTTPDRKLRHRSYSAAPPTYDDSPKSVISSVWSSHSQIQATTPTTSPHRPISRDLRISSPLLSKAGSSIEIKQLFVDYDSEESIIDSKPNTTGVRKLFTLESRNARTQSLRTSRTEPPKPALHAFTPFTARAVQQVWKAMSDIISRPLAPQQQTSGYIYGFQREENGYIKVGVSKNVKTRMRQWENQCNYQPKVVLQIAVPYAFRVERLIQLHLHNERYQEKPCNYGEGCDKKHGEWFKIGLERLRKVVAVWKRFVETEPYDEKHCLKPWWKQQLKTIDLYTHLDPWLRWLECVLDHNSVTIAKSDEVEEEQLGIKAEGKVEIKNSDHIIIKEELDSKSGLSQTEQEQVRRTPGRQIRMRIKLERGAMKSSSKDILDSLLDSKLSLTVAPFSGTAAAHAVCS